MGYTVVVFAQVKLSSQAEADLAKFEKTMSELPQVRECHLLAGDFDYILKVVAKDWDDYQNFHAKVLTTAPSVTSVKSSLAIRGTKDDVGVPIEE